MSDTGLFINHFHTPWSNEVYQDVLGLESHNHQGDLLGIRDRLPEDFDLLVSVTDHFRPPGEDYWKGLASTVEEENDGKARLNDATFYAEYDGKKLAAVNGVEASLEEENQHLNLNGLPLDDNDSYLNWSAEDLEDRAKDSYWLQANHVFLPGFAQEEERFRSFMEDLDSDGDVETAIGYTRGYGLLNKMANGETGGWSDVSSLEEEYGSSFLLPEIDLHSFIPRGMEGAGVVDTELFEEIERGNLPMDRIKEADVVEYDDPWKTLLDTKDAARTYNDMLPDGLRQYQGLADYIPGNSDLPDSDAGYRSLLEESLERLPELEPEEVKANSRSL